MPPDAGRPPAGPEEEDAPPFLTWRTIYALVLAALAIEAALGALLTFAYNRR
jgi:hypothetical protein